MPSSDPIRFGEGGRIAGFVRGNEDDLTARKRLLAHKRESAFRIRICKTERYYVRLVDQVYFHAVIRPRHAGNGAVFRRFDDRRGQLEIPALEQQNQLIGIVHIRKGIAENCVARAVVHADGTIARF